MYKLIFCIMILVVIFSCSSEELNDEKDSNDFKLDNISVLSPADDSTQVTTTEYLYIYFDKPAKYNSEKYLTIYNEDDSIFEEIDLDSNQIYVKKDDSIIINPKRNFKIGSSYYINFEKDLFNNGTDIVDKESWSFTVNSELNQNTIYSDEIGMEFAVPVLLPKNYSQDKKYPVIYLTDGNRGGYLQFSRIADLQEQGKLEDVIVVGVGYTEEYPIEEVRKFRSRDYRDKADTYYNFFVNEVISFINKRYSTEVTNNTIIGNSAGGNFTGYCLFQYRENNNFPFKNIVSVAPITNLLKEEKIQAAEINDLPVKFFLAVGEKDKDVFQSNFKIIKMNLLNKNYEGLRFEHRIIKGQPHGAQSSLVAYEEAIQLYYGKK